MRHAVFAGSFDPFTCGHEHILAQAVDLFDKITIAVAVNPMKPDTMFDLQERVSFVYDVAAHYNTVEVGSFAIKGPKALYTVDYATSIGAQFLIRGLRNAADFEYELSMSQVNDWIDYNVHTVTFIANRMYADISSSLVKGLIGPKDWQVMVRKLVPRECADRLVRLVEAKTHLDVSA